LLPEGVSMTTTYIATLPRSIYIEPTSRCNELCQQCPRTLLSREDDRDLSFENFPVLL
jgi:MoaA/NifB/PqqE/SkfB family radical SAM enzyme